MESIQLSSDWTAPLRKFNAEGVKCLVIGAYAYGPYAVPRATGDLHLWIDRDPENARGSSRTIR